MGAYDGTKMIAEGLKAAAVHLAHLTGPQSVQTKSAEAEYMNAYMAAMAAMAANDAANAEGVSADDAEAAASTATEQQGAAEAADALVRRTLDSRARSGRSRQLGDVHERERRVQIGSGRRLAAEGAQSRSNRKGTYLLPHPRQ